MKTILIDAGHGLFTTGKRCMKKLDPDETREWLLNDRIADMCEEKLLKYECRVLRADDTTGKKDIALSARVKAANQAGADIYISIHHNAGVNGGSGGGAMVFYYSGCPDRPRQAQRLYDAVVGRTGLRGNRSQKVVKKGFYVVKNTKMPAFLIENGFMDSAVDVPIILSKKHAERTAEGIVEWLVKELKLPLKDGSRDNSGNTSQPVPKALPAEKTYPAYIGKSASLVDALKSLGIPSDFSKRRQIAKANGIAIYTGSATQNTWLYNLLRAGMLKRV